MTDATALTVAEAASTGVIRTPLARLNELADFMAASGPMVGPSMQGHPERCRAVAFLADRWGMDPFSVSSEVFFFRNRDGKELMSFGAKLIVALVNAHAPLAKPLHVAFEGEGGSRRAVVTGWLKGADEPSVLRTPTVAQTRVKNSPLWRDDPDQQLSYAGQRSWARRYTPQAILGLYAPEEMSAVAEVQDVAPAAERAAALFDDADIQDAHFTAEASAEPNKPAEDAGPSLRERLDGAKAALETTRTLRGLERGWEIAGTLMDELVALDDTAMADELQGAHDAHKAELERRQEAAQQPAAA